MIDLSKVVALAEIEANKGIREDAGNNQDSRKEIQKYWKASWISDGFEKKLPYCCVTIVWCYTTAGIQIRPTALCSDLVAWAKKGGDANAKAAFVPPTETPIIGDILVLDTSNDGEYNHVALVIKVEGKKLTTVEGNTGSGGTQTSNDPKDKLSGVWKRNRYIGVDKISGYVRIIDTKVTRVVDSPDKPSDRDTFLALLRMELSKSKERASGAQIMLDAFPGIDIKIDGSWGPKSSEAAATVFDKYIKKL